ncbi:unnamed protein product [Brassica rapa subsp. narinosa]|uniref:(rape) hypothetical protein n=1 Tax=Brassica napus TaxID=3708 RepID=A0A817AZC8_BRANA|nr:unnamed protein product [Brassica napus]
MSMKPNGKSIISSSDDNSACFLRRQPRSYVFQRNIPGPSRRRSCSSLNGTVIQGFVPPGRIKKFLPHMRQGSLYTLASFYGSRNKDGEDKKLKTQLASREKFYGKFLLSNLSTSKFQLEFKHRHEEVKVDLAEACMIPCFSQSNSFPSVEFLFLMTSM